MVFLDNHYLVLDMINEWGARLFPVSRKFVGRSLIPFSRNDYLLKSNRGANFNSYEYHFCGIIHLQRKTPVKICWNSAVTMPPLRKIPLPSRRSWSSLWNRPSGWRKKPAPPIRVIKWRFLGPRTHGLPPSAP